MLQYSRAAQRLIEMHHSARVGHLGGNISCLSALVAIVNKIEEGDRLVLSKGHSAGALYVAMCQIGLLSDSDLSTFHRDGTSLPGHPPANAHEFIPFATGSLGHGLSLACGLALSRTLRHQSGKVYCLTSDGEWQEGSTWEALIFACKQGLGKRLRILVDHNGYQGFGSTAEVAGMDPLWERLIGFPIDPVIVDGHDLVAISAALERIPSKVIFENSNQPSSPFKNAALCSLHPLTSTLVVALLLGILINELRSVMLLVVLNGLIPAPPLSV